MISITKETVQVALPNTSRYFATGADRPAGVVKITGSGLANPYA